MDSQNVIPFYKPSIGTAEIEEVVETLRSGWLTTGPKTKEFEKEFSRYLEAPYSVAVNSCTAALHLALEAIGLEEGDGVVVPTMTFAATAGVVRYFKGHCIFADCREEDFNVDPEDAERRIREALARGIRVKAIIPVHYGGQIGAIDKILALAAKYQLRVIEDAAHCCPAYYRGHRDEDWKAIGAESDISCFSFYANKTITTGEGGMACTHDGSLAERMRLMSLHGISRDPWRRYRLGGNWYYEIVAPGFKYNPSDLASALGLVQLRRADELHQRRMERAALYYESLSDLDEVILPQVQENRIHSWHLYVIRLRLERLEIDRAAFIEELRSEGIGTSVHWMPLHMHPYYRDSLGLEQADFPVASRLYPEMVSLPLYPDMSEKDVLRVAEAVKRVVRATKTKKAMTAVMEG